MRELDFFNPCAQDMDDDAPEAREIVSDHCLRRGLGPALKIFVIVAQDGQESIDIFFLRQPRDPAQKITDEILFCFLRAGRGKNGQDEQA